MIVGFVVCAPLGPVGILCLQRTMTAGRLPGFFSILGAAAVDAFYGAVAGFGLNLIAGTLAEGKCWFPLFGGMVLVVVGIRLGRASPISRISQDPVKNSVDAFLSTIALMLSNPLPILVISAALSAISGGTPRMGVFDVLLFASGVFLGSLLWFPLLVTASARVRPMLRPEHLRVINRLCGAVVFLCGLLLSLSPLIRHSM